MLRRSSVWFAALSCTVFLAFFGGFVVGYWAGHLEALHDFYFLPAIVVRERPPAVHADPADDADDVAPSQ